MALDNYRCLQGCHQAHAVLLIFKGSITLAEANNQETQRSEYPKRWEHPPISYTSILQECCIVELLNLFFWS